MASEYSVVSDDQNMILHKIDSGSFKMNSCHAHSHNELLFVVDNDIVVENNTDTVIIHSPAVIIHNAFTLHRAMTVNESSYERYVLNFNDDVFQKSGPLSEKISFFKRVNMTIIRLTDEMRDLLILYFSRYKIMNGDPDACSHLTALILYELSQYYSESNSVLLEPKLPYINDVMLYISRNADEPLTLDELSKRFFVSRAKLVSDFRSSTGMTVKNYITIVRMNMARILLMQGKSVSETASLCGYNSESNFITTFKKLFHVSPGNFIDHLEERRKISHSE